jgi:hypothetical protein
MGRNLDRSPTGEVFSPLYFLRVAQQMPKTLSLVAQPAPSFLSLRGPPQGPMASVQPWPARPGLRRPQDDRVWTELTPPPWGKSFHSLWSSTESTPNENKNHVGLESASLTSCWNKFPYIRSHPEQFSPAESSSNPSHCHTIMLPSTSSQPPRKDCRSPPLPLVFSPSLEVHRRPAQTISHAWGRKVTTTYHPHRPLPPLGSKNELATSSRLHRDQSRRIWTTGVQTRIYPVSRRMVPPCVVLHRGWGLASHHPLFIMQPMTTIRSGRTPSWYKIPIVHRETNDPD